MEDITFLNDLNNEETLFPFELIPLNRNNSEYEWNSAMGNR